MSVGSGDKDVGRKFSRGEGTTEKRSKNSQKRPKIAPLSLSGRPTEKKTEK